MSQLQFSIASRAPAPLRTVLAAALVWICLSAPLYGQSFTASLQGTVTDSSTALVPEARMTLTNQETNVKTTAVSNERGRYLFARVPPGVYTLTAEVAGFKTYVRSGIPLEVQQQALVDVVLTPGEVTSKIEVTGEAPRLDAVDATLGRVVDNRSVANMPLGNRNAMALVGLTAGIINAGQELTTNWVSNGTRNAQADVILDGVTVTVHEQNGGVTDQKFQPSVEAVQEFRVQTNSFSAEFGFTGGAVVNMITRSGTNELHGSLFEFLRNSTLNANTFFSNRSGGKLVPWRRNQFGGSVGGPVVLPKIYDGRNRTFFFAHIEASRRSGFEESTLTLPTVGQKQGDFGDYLDAQGRLITIFDPYAVTQNGSNYTRASFPNNIIPQARMDPVGARMMKYYPDPNRDGNQYTRINNFYDSGSRTNDDFQTYPSAVTCTGGRPPEGGQVPLTTSLCVEYPENFLAVFTVGDEAMRYRTYLDQTLQYHGTKARLDVGREWFALYPEDRAALELKAAKEVKKPNSFVRATHTHMENFLECIRSRKDPNATVEMGNYASATLAMAVESLRTGRRIRFNRQSRRMEA